MSALAPTLQGFFTERMLTQRRSSPNTVASYRDTFRLLLAFVQHRTGKTPSKLALEDIDAVLIGAFLDHLERERRNSVRTRNTRLAAVHSLFAYAALRHPEHAALIQRVLAIPAKRTDRQLLSFLTRDEVDALLAAPDRGTWIGRRDHALLLVAVQTGLRHRTHNAHLPRRRARHRRPPALPRQGPQRADHATDHPNVWRPWGLAGRASRRPG